MSATLTHILNEIKELSIEELFMLQRKLIDLVQAKVVPANSSLANSSEKLSRRSLVVPPSYKRNPEEVEALLLAVFGLEQLTAMKDVDLTDLEAGSKNVTDLISEDREDRF